MAKSCKIYFPDTEYNESAYINRTHESELYLFPALTGSMYVTRFDYTYELVNLSNVIEIGCSDAVLFNKVYGTGADFGVEVGNSSVVLDTKDSLGSYDDGIAVGLMVAESVTKRITAKNKIGIGASVDIVMNRDIEIADSNVIEIGAEAAIVYGYYRLLNEMDDDTLATYDSETIKDVDYIVTS